MFVSIVARTSTRRQTWLVRAPWVRRLDLVAVSDSVRTKEIAAKVLINLACSMEGHQADTTVKNVLKCVAVLVTHRDSNNSQMPTRSSSAPRPFWSWPVYRKRGPCWPSKASSLC